MTQKTKAELEAMRKAGLLLWQTHQIVVDMVAPGVNTAAIDAAVDEFISKNGALALFKGVPGKYPYPAATCISVNEEVVHGIPGNRTLKDGDIVGVDIGLKLDGWCSDCAQTLPVGTINDEKQKLIDVTEECLRIAINEMKPEIKWSKIAKKMAKYARSAGFSVVEDLIGHGIGREMWERPQVPNYWAMSLPDFRLKQGMVLAVEPMINAGVKSIKTLADHWTIVTTDGKPSAHFEHSIAVTATGAQVLTCGPNGEGWAL